MKSQNFFLYFAYGSNLLKRRIHRNNPSAEFIGVGLLKDHQLDFVNYSEHWRGSVATIVPVQGGNVWGAVWKLNSKDLPALDKQEGVEEKMYFSKLVKIDFGKGAENCRTYQSPITYPIRAILPLDRRPSVTYKECIVQGAIECSLPDNYIKLLKTIPDNGQHAALNMRNIL